MSKRSSVGKSMFVRNWSNFQNQPEFDNPSIQRGLDLAKKLSKESKDGK